MGKFVMQDNMFPDLVRVVVVADSYRKFAKEYSSDPYKMRAAQLRLDRLLEEIMPQIMEFNSIND